MIEKSRLDEELKIKNRTPMEDTAGEIEELHKMYQSCEKDRNKFQLEVLSLKKENGTLERKAALYEETKRQLDKKNEKVNALREELINKELSISKSKQIKEEKEQGDAEHVIA